MLEHADARNLVERLGLGHVAIVLQSDLDAIAQAELAHTLCCILELAVAQRDAESLHPVVLCGPEYEPAPAAADVKKALAGPQHQFAANVIELLFLCDVERIVLVLEVRARVHAVAVEPQPVEVVTHVIVMLNVATVRGTGVTP